MLFLFFFSGHWPALVLVRELAASGLPVDADAYGLMLQVCQRAGASRMAQSLAQGLGHFVDGTFSWNRICFFAFLFVFVGRPRGTSP